MKQSLLTAMYLSVCVLGILGVSGLIQPHGKQFYYTHSKFRRSDDCNICYEEECLPLDQSRCDYYVEAELMLPKEEQEPEGFLNPQLKSDIDNYVFTMIEKAALTPDMECIPYLSRYTDCTKENICTGCKTCRCAHDGKWSCNSTSHCRTQEPAFDIDHRVLIMTIENVIGSIKTAREKRSATSNPVSSTSASTIGVEQLAEWFYGSKAVQRMKEKNEDPTGTDDYSHEHNHSSPTTESILLVHSEHTSIESATEGTRNTDPDYLAFDEVLSNIAVDTKNYTRRKPPLDIEPNKTAEFDYMLVDEDNKTLTDNTSTTTERPLDNMTEISYIVNFMHDDDVTEPTLEENTKIVIDLLESAKDNVFNETDYVDLGTNKEDLLGIGFDNTNDILDYNAINLMKRDLSSVSDPTEAPNNTISAEIRTINATADEKNTTQPYNYTNLKENVLLPVIKAINNIKNELDDLTKIKENLVNFMNSNNQSPIVEVLDYPNVSETNMLHDIEMFPDLVYDLRRTNPNLMQKFLYKLKSDIYEVIKDILGLQRYRQGELPDDLNILIHALKRYVNKNKPFKKKLKPKPVHHYRRRWEASSSKCMESTFKECIVEILQAIDKDMPKGNALAPLSVATQRIMRHVIKTYYTDEFTNIGLRVHDPNYNMTNDLSTIGSKWQEMANNVVGNSPFITLYRMKLLQIFLETDINKMNDALALIAFAHSRRMTPYFKNVHNNVIEQINDGLKSVRNKFEIVVQYYSSKGKDEPVTAIVMRGNDDMKSVISPIDSRIDQVKVAIESRQQKKRSFIKHIRNLLKSSKRDIGELLHRQIPKSEIVKQLARKKLDEIAQKRYNEYEESMKKWQKNLGIMGRYKRNTFDEVASRIKNIIPKYLRRKVKPKLHDKKKNGTNKQGNDNGKKKKKHGLRNKHKKTTLTTATTPKTKATTPKKKPTTPKTKATTPKAKTTKKSQAVTGSKTVNKKSKN